MAQMARRRLRARDLPSLTPATATRSSAGYRRWTARRMSLDRRAGRRRHGHAIVRAVNDATGCRPARGARPSDAAPRPRSPACFAVALIALGLFIARRVKGASDFFVAGRQLGPGLLFSTFLAANIGAGSTVGAAGLGYRDGLSAWWWVGSAGTRIAGARLVDRPEDLARLPRTHNLRTVGDFLEWRYDARVRATAHRDSLGRRARHSRGTARRAVEARDTSCSAGEGWIGCVIGGARDDDLFRGRRPEVVGVGQHGAARREDARLLHRAADRAQRSSADSPVCAPPRRRATTGIFWSGRQSGWMYLAFLGPSFIVSPGLLQKIYGARDDRAVRIGVGLNALGLLSYAIIPILLGMIARVCIPASTRSRARAADAARARSAADRRLAGARGAVLARK